MAVGTDTSRVSIRNIFGDNIVLRNLEPKNTAIPGLHALRGSLSIPPGVIPRKNEPLYAVVVEAFLQHLSKGNVKTVFYVGDSFHNDGNAIRNLSERRSFDVLGYLCKDLGKNSQEDICIGEIIFSENWENLWKLYREGRDRGLGLGAQLVGIFDLDGTVYAAKGRHDAPLKAARLEAVCRILGIAIPQHRYDIERTTAIYRELDRDKYHPFTLDNQDYVVFLTLVICLGIYDMEDVRRWLQTSASITGIINNAMERVERMAPHEPIAPALDKVREVFFNTNAGDQTPFKTFREAEYFATRAWMSQEGAEAITDVPLSRIALNREVLDLVHFLKSQGSLVLALSDRPIESTEPDLQVYTDAISLHEIPMSPLGSTIEHHLKELL